MSINACWQLLELHAKELEAAVAHESRAEEMHEHLVLGRLHRVKHDYGKAKQHLSDALALGMAALDYNVSADANLELGILHYYAHDLLLCRKHLQRAQADIEQAGRSMHTSAVVEFWQGRAAAREASWQEAAALLRDALVKSQSAADQALVAKTCFELANVYHMLDDRELALQFFAQASAINDHLWDHMESSSSGRALPSHAESTAASLAPSRMLGEASA